MRAREYNKRLEIFAVNSVSDGIGGFKETVTSLGKFWCKMETFKVPSSYQNTDNEFLKAETGNALRITTRVRNDLNFSSFNNYVVYRGYKWNITTDSTNFNFIDNYVQFVVTRGVTIGPQTTGIYQNYNSRVNTGSGELASATCTNEYVTKLTSEINV